MLLRAAAQLESPAFSLMNVFPGKFVLDVTHLMERIGISSAPWHDAFGLGCQKGSFIDYNLYDTPNEHCCELPSGHEEY